MPPKSGSILFDMQVTLEPPFFGIKGPYCYFEITCPLCRVFHAQKNHDCNLDFFEDCIFFSPHPFCQSVAKGARS